MLRDASFNAHAAANLYCSDYIINTDRAMRFIQQKNYEMQIYVYKMCLSPYMLIKTSHCFPRHY
jgi:hypothetical protein